MADSSVPTYFLHSMAGGDDYTGDRVLRQVVKKNGVDVDGYRLIRTGSTGVDINHGWKIHGDFGSRLSPADAARRMGLAFRSPTFDTSKGMVTVDKAARAAFESRLAKIAPETSLGQFASSFFGTFETETTPKYKINDLSKGLGFLGFGRNQDDPSGFGFVDPLDILSMQEAFTEEGVDYKAYPDRYGKGRHFTGYPQSLEQRDKIISNLEARVSSGQLNLVRQDDPTYRGSMASGPTGKGDTNSPLSPHIQGRFTTDYAPAPDPVTGVVDYSKSGTASDPITGYMSDEQMAKIEKLKQTNPEFQEILHGSPGYKSPYRTIEQIAQDRKSGVIPPSDPNLKSYKGFWEFLSDDPAPAAAATTTTATAAVPKAGEPVKSPEPEVKKEKPKAVIKTTKNGRPTIKVGKVVESGAGETAEDEAEVSADPIESAIEDAKDVASSSKPLDEAVKDKVESKIKDKLDPTKKIGEKVEEIREGLIDSIFEESNKQRAARLGSADPSPVTARVTKTLDRLTNASGKARGSADSVLGKSAGAASKFVSKSKVTKELLESGGDMARAVVAGTKNSKNLRLAGAATLLSAAGYGIGKLKNRQAEVKKDELKVNPDEEAALRESLLNDG